MTHATQIETEAIYSARNDFPRFVLIGLGPFAKRHYFQFFAKHHVFPELIIDLDCKREELTQFLSSKSISIPTYFVPEALRNVGQLPDEIKREIAEILRREEVTHAVVATEPKAHFAYLDFLIDLGIHILVEKPITAPILTSHATESADKIESEYLQLLKKAKASPVKNLRVDLQCQRRYHPVYKYVMKQVEAFVAEFDIPMTFCDIYHSDGMWNMPDEFLFRENHPYKYGYGKLLHSGYHFIDLLGWLIKTCNGVCSKVSDRAELYAVPFSPRDSLGVFTEADYQHFFPQKNYHSIFANPTDLGFDQFGELDFFSLIQLFQGHQKLTTCSMNLLQTGFSQRSWDYLPEDTYKGSGRVRHERLNLQFGPLFNIQVHSYVANQDSKSLSTVIGGDKHFDVYLFRNAKLIGGETFTKLTTHDFVDLPSQSFNEISRESCFMNFLLNGPSLSTLEDHKLGIQFLSRSLKALSKKNHTERFILRK